jgi:hypothetical protein
MCTSVEVNRLWEDSRHFGGSAKLRIQIAVDPESNLSNPNETDLSNLVAKATGTRLFACRPGDLRDGWKVF